MSHGTMFLEAIYREPIPDNPKQENSFTFKKIINFLKVSIQNYPIHIYQEPLWDETFTFEIDEYDRYLNVCVWNRIPLSSGTKDILIGYTCVPLMDVALQCLNTKAGEHLQLCKLHPPEQRAGAT